jgi:hypothetical protein
LLHFVLLPYRSTFLCWAFYIYYTPNSKKCK